MGAEISYWSGRGDTTASPYGVISSESVSTSGSSAQSGVNPDEATFVSIVCTAAPIRVAYGPDPIADASSAYVSAGERIWMTAHPGWKLAAVDA